MRGPDLNQRPSGYEPDELPDCSTPQRRGIYTRLIFISQIQFSLKISYLVQYSQILEKMNKHRVALIASIQSKYRQNVMVNLWVMRLSGTALY